MPWVPETPEAQPVPIRPDFLIRCKVLVLKLIAQYKILKGTMTNADPMNIDVPLEELQRMYLETANKFRIFQDDEEPLDDNDLIHEQSYIPTLEEADKLGRYGPQQGGGKSVHA
eukprot:11319697-Prorocentrum_lima.AAC.1